MLSGSVEATAILLGERIDTRNYETSDIVNQNPLAYRLRTGGLVVVYRFGAVVFFGVDQETQFLTISELGPRITDVASQRFGDALRGETLGASASDLVE